MVDFPEYYAQMLESLRRAPAAATPTPVAPSQEEEPITVVPPVPPPIPTQRASVTREAPPTSTPDASRNALTAPMQQTPSILDMLRQRMQAQIDDESNQRLREIGIGMLRSQSPNFFENLGAGFAAAEEGSRARMERLRQIADAERQARAQQAEEDFRREQLGIERQRRAAEERRINAEIATGRRPNIVTMIDPETRNAVLVNAETGQVVSRTPFRPMQDLRNAPRPLTQAQIANIRQQVTRLASEDAGIVQGVAPTPAQIARRDELADRYFRDRLDAAAAGLLNIQGEGTPGTASTGTAGSGRTPSEVLQYGGPTAPAAPRSGPRISAQPQQ